MCSACYTLRPASSRTLWSGGAVAPHSPKISAQLKKRAKQIKVLLMDVDGTITNGGVTLLSMPDGSAMEIKTFDAHDGQGMTLARTAGIRTGVITGRESAALRRRCREMGIEFVYEKQPQKIPARSEEHTSELQSPYDLVCRL